ncbi:MAG: (2Fe-2S)-binding protein [Gammaproteobacteria bacterium]
MIIILITIRITINVIERTDDIELMYVCICNSVTESDIKKAVKDGANCFHQLESKLGVSNQCGSCRCEVDTCLERSLEKQMGSSDLIAF